MESFRVELGPDSHTVHVGSGLFRRIGEFAEREGLLRSQRLAIVTDSNVASLYGSAAAATLPGATLISVPAGEASKSIEALTSVYDLFARAELERSSTVFAIGGGVVGDLAGFAAATYLRGLPLVQLPTTLLAQVDSALGGKTAINLAAGKNLVGAFYQPRLIVADVDTLGTLPAREFREGLAEVIKYGAIMDAAFFEYLEREMPSILAREQSAMIEIVNRSLRYKAFVVADDEKESGARKTLNFGHTVGHALEASSGYGNYLHGEAVAIGMVAAASLSAKHAGLSLTAVGRIQRLLEQAGLPTAMPDNFRSSGFRDALRLDKKRAGEAIEFVLLDRIGHAITHPLTFDQIASE